MNTKTTNQKHVKPTKEKQASENQQPLTFENNTEKLQPSLEDQIELFARIIIEQLIATAHENN